ncbi:vitamin K epoxide reductase family protein [Nocardiopsis salina]|uniref:vitamin K epoxide reductase family protein n=1 Tax=Nocardiopsis salina TaxID=245836 RepID=UPI00034512EC|nr:vitamin K epoxide reductase family protein [Nocardiopsis salina]
MTERESLFREGGTSAERWEQLRQHHRRIVWIPCTLMFLGFWQLLAPLTLAYRKEELWAVPSGGRGPWFFEDATMDVLRADLTTWSAVGSGALLVVLGWLALRPNRPVVWWGACFVGLWLLSAPIMLWTPSAAAYVNDTLVGTLVVALTIVLPGIPNEPAFESKGKATPPGWSYNPSSWPQRLILIAVACVGLFASRYLAAYQLGYVDEVWDPFFGFSEGTQRVLDSELSHAFPVSDAGLGAIAYNLEILAVLGGNAARWRTSPWTVAIFGVLVLPLGLAHVALIMSMPVIVQAWCTLCLVAGAVALPMVVFAVDEVVAMGQHLRRAREQGDRGGSTWKVFWLGSTSEGSTADGRTPQMLDLGERPIRVVGASLWGASARLPLLGAVALSILLYATPGIYGLEPGEPQATVAHIGGAVLIVVTAVAVAEVIRPARLLAVVAGPAVAVSVWFTGAGPAVSVLVLGVGLVAAALSLPRGPFRESYGDWSSVAAWPRSLGAPNQIMREP